MGHGISHLRKEIFRKRECNKLKMKKIGPSRILKFFSTNAYELELPMGIGISPVFNVVYSYPYQYGDECATTPNGSNEKIVKKIR